MTDGITAAREGPVTVLTLDRPEVMNRLESAMREGLLAALRDAAADTSVRVVVITGAGDRAFSAGADVEGMVALHEAGDVDEIRRRVTLGGDIISTIRTMPLPVVAAVNGVAAGAGANLALACDLRLGSPSAAFVQSFVRIGLVPDWGGLWTLQRIVGPGRATRMMMTGGRVDADEAVSLGMLDQICGAEELLDEALAVARDLAALPAGALGAIKAGLDLAATATLDEVLAWERSAQADLFAQPDCGEGLRAFLERRAPAFDPHRPPQEPTHR